MPTSALMQLPKSRSAEEFESMCANVLSNVFKSSFVQYGRRGQEQKGIDLFAQLDSQTIYVAQCKNYFNSSYKALCSQILADIQSANGLEFTISKFIVMTSLDRDVSVQNFIAENQQLFNVQIMFWEDIQSEIYKDENLLKVYYPQFYYNQGVSVMDKNLIIKCANTLKSCADRLNSNYINHQVAYYPEVDNAIYNECISMYNSVVELNELCGKWYIQLNERGIIHAVESIVSSMPEFFDEHTDGTGVSLICTIHGFLKYFVDDVQTECFKKVCQDIINMTLSWDE